MLLMRWVIFKHWQLMRRNGCWILNYTLPHNSGSMINWLYLFTCTRDIEGVKIIWGEAGIKLFGMWQSTRKETFHPNRMWAELTNSKSCIWRKLLFRYWSLVAALSITEGIVIFVLCVLPRMTGKMQIYDFFSFVSITTATKMLRWKHNPTIFNQESSLNWLVSSSSP